MKTLTKLFDNNISKEYELAIFTVGELRDLIIKTSGLTIQDIRIKYDSLYFDKSIQAVDDVNLFKQETLEYYKENIDDKKIYKKFIRWASKNTDNHTFWDMIQPHPQFGSPNQETIDYYGNVAQDILKCKDLKEIADYLSTLEHKIFGNSSSYRSINLRHILKENVSYDVKNLHENYLYYLENGFDSIAYSSETSKSYKKYSENVSVVRDIDKKEESFLTDRVDATELGIENYNFVVEKVSNGYILLDGFNRLFGSNYTNDDKEIIVKVYENITDKDYGQLVLNLNDWKMRTLVMFNRNIFDYYHVFDRGVLFSLYSKFGIEKEDVKKYFRNIILKSSYTMYGKNRELFVNSVIVSIEFSKLAEEKNINKLVTEYLLSTKNDKINSSDKVTLVINTLIESPLFNKLNNYKSENGVKTFLTESNELTNELYKIFN